MEDLRFRHPFSMLISGPTGSGKTRLVLDFLCEHEQTTTIGKPVIRVLYCYGIWQEFYERFSNHKVDINFHQGFAYDYLDMKPDVIVVDDLMEELSRDKHLTAMFTKTSHHQGISVILLTQNLFFQSKQMRTISLNSHYIVLLKNPRDQLQVMTLGRQIFPTNSTFFNQAYDEAVKQPYSHLIIDMTSSCPDWMRLRQRETVKGQSGFTVFEMRQ